MKLSPRTLDILKNYSTINPSILLKPGKEIRTIHPQKTIISVATIEDDFPSEAPIYDLGRFLSVYNLYDDPDVTFEEKDLVISDGRRKTRYRMAAKSVLFLPPEGSMNIPSVVASIPVTQKDLADVLKASSALGLPDIGFVAEDGKIYLRALSIEDPKADTFGIEIGETSDTFRLMIKKAAIKFVSQDYQVNLSSKGAAEFTGNGITYVVGVDPKSTYTSSTN